MKTVLSQKQLEYQQEIINESGHQNWHKLLVHDFGGNNIEISVMPYETWSEPSDEDFKPLTARGDGDRQRSAEVAARRAKRKVRHKCKLLKAKYMLTLTTKEIITDTEKFQSLFQEFVRRLRKVSTFEYVATHELQQRGALHLHIAIANRQDYKVLWSIWNRVVGAGQGRVHVRSGNRKASTNQIAAYISKYIAKSFETGELNKRRYWASKGIGEPVKVTHLLRSDWSIAEVITYIIELCNEYGVDFMPDPRFCWQNLAKGLFWIACTPKQYDYADNSDFIDLSDDVPDFACAA